MVASERVTLYGIPLVASRRVGYAAVDPALCRELFIRHALVEGDWDTRHRFFHANREQVARVEELEHRARRRDILVDDQTLVDFYDARIGAEVVSGRHFDSWWKRVGRSQPHLLDYPLELLIDPDAAPVSPADFPDTWAQGELRLPLSYRFEPGSDADGVTVHIPLAVLNQVSGDGFDWQVPGLREDLVAALIRSLPKAVRREFVPASDVAGEVLERLRPDGRPLVEALGTRVAPADRHTGAPGRLGSGQGAGPPEDDLPGVRRRGPPAGPGQGPGGAAA